MGNPLAFHARVCYTCGEIKAGAMPVSSIDKGDTMSSYHIADDLYRSPLREAVLYQLSLRSFTEEGTLKAAEEKLPHIAALGVDMIYLTSLSKADPYPDPAYFSRMFRMTMGQSPSQFLKSHRMETPEDGTPR